MSVSLSKLKGIMNDKEAWHAAVHGSQRVGHNLANNNKAFRDYTRKLYGRCEWLLSPHSESGLSLTNAAKDSSSTCYAEIIENVYMFVHCSRFGL